jgi:hypothetical protein
MTYAYGMIAILFSLFVAFMCGYNYAMRIANKEFDDWTRRGK